MWQERIEEGDEIEMQIESEEEEEEEEEEEGEEEDKRGDERPEEEEDQEAREAKDNTQVIQCGVLWNQVSEDTCDSYLWKTTINAFVAVRHNNILLLNLLATSFGHQTIIMPSLHEI